jgi:PST family polysaccharide transporter
MTSSTGRSPRHRDRLDGTPAARTLAGTSTGEHVHADPPVDVLQDATASGRSAATPTAENRAPDDELAAERLADTAAGVDPTDVASPGTDELMRAGASGAVWLGVANILGKVILLVTTVVLARILAPSEFGLVSLSLVLLVYADAVTDAGVAQALIYLPRSAAATRAALLCSIVTGLALTVAVQLAAPLIAAFFDSAAVEPLIRLLSFSLLGSSLAAVPDALLRRSLTFNKVTIAALVRGLVSSGVSIGLALAGYGAYALVWGTVAAAAVYVVLVWSIVPERPDLAFWRTSRADVRELMGYGLPVAGSTLLAKLVFDVDYLIIGRVLGATALGYYTLAFRLPESLILNVFFVLSMVVFPIYAQVRGDMGKLRSGYLFSLRVFALYGVCAGVGLAVTSQYLVPLAFGDQWDDAVVPLIALALYCASRSLTGGANEVYKAVGRPGLSLWLSLARLVVLVPTLTVAALQWGIVGVAWGQFGTSMLFSVVAQVLVARVLETRWTVLARQFMPALAAGGAIALVTLPLALLPLSQAAGLAVVVAGGVLAALVTLAIGYPKMLRELTNVVRRQPVAT